MLAKLKRPDCYIGHGVFVFPEGYFYPVKRKITDAMVWYSFGEWTIIHVFVNGIKKPLQPDEIFMTKREACNSEEYKMFTEIRKHQQEIDRLKTMIRWKKEIRRKNGQPNIKQDEIDPW